MLPMRDKQQTSEDRATQPMDAGWLSFAKMGLIDRSLTGLTCRDASASKNQKRADKERAPYQQIC